MMQYLWPKSDGPRYVTAMASSAGFSLATLIAAWVMRFVLMRSNRKLRADGNVTVFYAY
jgi:hypothetical protein